jgi:hypothetical protein
MTLEFNILSLFMKNLWFLTSRTTQNTTSKPKNFTIFPLILRERDAEKTRFQAAKTQKMTNFSWRWNSIIWVYLWRTSDCSHPEPHKTRLRNLKISPFFLLTSEKEMLITRVFSQLKRRRWPIISWRRNSNFWGYLWRTTDGSHPEPHKTRLRNLNLHHFSSYPQRKWCWENAFSASENA